MKITEMRREFDGTALRRGSMPAEPLTQFEKWFSDAAGKGAASPLLRGKMRLYRAFQILSGKAETIDANAMTLATATRDGQPSARTVLLKEVDDRGFIFFTNYESRKGRELEENPRAALTFFWPSFARQVCVTGTVSKISRVESEKYFNSRPRGSRVGALASNQSAIVENRHELEKRFEELGHEFERGEIPTPSYWGGYALAPESIEFWQGQPSRLHDRIRYTKERGGHWKIERLAP